MIIACCSFAGFRVLGVTCELASVQGVVVCLTVLPEVDADCLLGSRGDGIRKRRDVVGRIGEAIISFSLDTALEVTVETV